MLGVNHRRVVQMPDKRRKVVIKKKLDPVQVARILQRWQTLFVWPPDQVSNDALVKVEKMVEKMRTENIFLHEELVARKTAHARVLISNI